MQYEPVSVTPNGHSVGSVTAGDSIGQNAVATATPVSTMYKCMYLYVQVQFRCMYVVVI